jgi:hypothetical protein
MSGERAIEQYRITVLKDLAESFTRDDAVAAARSSALRLRDDAGTALRTYSVEYVHQ